MQRLHVGITKNPRKRLAFLCLAVFLQSLFFTACVTQDLESKVDEYIHAHLKLHKFSGSILIAQKGKILMSKGYGMANYELGVPNTPQTKFLLGSITKQFTSMAVMQLQEKGLLSVEDSLKKYIPDYPNGDKITIHHLLTHTSGIPNFTSFPEYTKTMMLASPVEETIERFKNKKLEFTPGEKFSYSNSGYILLGYIIEKVSQKSYEAYLEENILQPLGLEDTGYGHHEPIFENRAAGYSWDKDHQVNASYLDMSIPHGAGALYSTVEDLYLWDRALYTEKLVSKSSLDKIFSPFKDNYGYGWGISELFGHKRISHGGGINGFTTNISRYPDDDVCIIVLSNFDYSSTVRISRDLAAIVFGEKYEFPKERKEVKVDPKIYNAYVGQYELEPGFIITITKENERLFAQATGQPKAEIYPESEIKFFLKVVDAQMTFVKDDKGEVTQLVLHQGGQDQPAKKIK
ncbi:MAG: serine hydrolase [Candidatus Aminicenantes bacterium]|nr:serine hydrolase [Candidatus Aminicenantes bacterium]